MNQVIRNCCKKKVFRTLPEGFFLGAGCKITGFGYLVIYKYPRRKPKTSNTKHHVKLLLADLGLWLLGGSGFLSDVFREISMLYVAADKA